jgi:hypothetical protein
MTSSRSPRARRSFESECTYARTCTQHTWPHTLVAHYTQNNKSFLCVGSAASFNRYAARTPSCYRLILTTNVNLRLKSGEYGEIRYNEPAKSDNNSMLITEVATSVAAMEYWHGALPSMAILSSTTGAMVMVITRGSLSVSSERRCGEWSQRYLLQHTHYTLPSPQWLSRICVRRALKTSAPQCKNAKDKPRKGKT